MFLPICLGIFLVGMLFVPSAFADVTSINFRDVQQNPDSFIGDSVNLTGKITADDFQGYGVAVEVGGLGIGMADISDRIKYQILFEKSQKSLNHLKEWCQYQFLYHEVF